MVGLNSKLDTDIDSRDGFEDKSEQLNRRQHRDIGMKNMKMRLQDMENKIKRQHMLTWSFKQENNIENFPELTKEANPKI